MEKKHKSRLINKKDMTMKRVQIVFIVLLGILLVVLYGAYANVTEIENQVNQNLEDVSRQNATVLETKINAQYNLLVALSKELQGVTEDRIAEKLGYYEVFLEEFHLKRFAISFRGGVTYSTDGTVTNLSYRSFYRKGMEGKCCITGVLEDALKEEHAPVNVMTIPIYGDTGTVSAVFGLAYDTEKFNETLQIESFEGMGQSCIINEDGEILSAGENSVLKLSGNIEEDLRNADVRNERNIEQLRGLIENREDGSGIMYLPGKSYYHIVPVDLMDGSVTWYILTIIPSEVVSQRLDPIQKNQYVTGLLVMLLVALGALLIIMYIREQHKQMLSFAYEDEVTEGANYTKFQMEMERKADRRGWLVAMDIANFNNILVVAGEVASDIMLKETWKIISAVLDKEELAAHLRDEMFLMFLSQPQEEALFKKLEQISERIYEKAKEFHVHGIQARYGIYQMAERETLETAYSKVKLAIECVAVKPGLSYAFYDEANRVKMQYEKQLEDDFPKAMEKEEFEVWYQPKYSAQDCQIVGSEALVRWKIANGDMISPGKFIPLFEHNGMIVKLDEYMFRTVCRQQKRWLDEGRMVYPVSINISRASLYSMDVHKRYQDIMQEYGIEPRYIQLEVTESAMTGKADVRELLNNFRSSGIKILMDDFGTGYSSLATLSLQCFDTLKLDKSLIDRIGDKDGEVMLYHIISMGQQMGLHITAEGVEKWEQLSFLQSMKCDDIQGFFFSKPVARNVYERMVNNDSYKMGGR